MVGMCCCMETLIEASKSLHEECVRWSVLTTGHFPLREHATALNMTLQLQQTLCHQTALYATKLMKVCVCVCVCEVPTLPPGH